MQNGMLMKNTPRQLQYCENAPPTKGPSAVPIAAKPRTMPIARLCLAPLNVLDTTAMATGKISAAPTPCTTRAAISQFASGAAPQTADRTPNRTSPHTMILRRPNMSASRPPVTISAPIEIM